MPKDRPDLVSQPPTGALLCQMLGWIAARPRQYGETMDAWRTSCPRLTVWEDAVDAGLVRIDSAAASQSRARVLLTAEGESLLRRNS